MASPLKGESESTSKWNNSQDAKIDKLESTEGEKHKQDAMIDVSGTARRVAESEKLPPGVASSSSACADRPVAVVNPQAEARERNTLSPLTDESSQELSPNEESTYDQPLSPNAQNAAFPPFPPNSFPNNPESFQAYYPFPSEKGRMYFRSWRNLTQQRRLFSTDQLVGLKAAFEDNAYPSRVQFQEIADSLKMKEKSVRLWFQNRRARLRKSGTISETDLPQPSQSKRSTKRVTESTSRPSIKHPSPRLSNIHQLPSPASLTTSPSDSEKLSSRDEGTPELGEITPGVRRHWLQQMALMQQQAAVNMYAAHPSMNLKSNVDSPQQDDIDKRRESYRKRMQSNPYFKYYNNLSGMHNVEQLLQNNTHSRPSISPEGRHDTSDSLSPQIHTISDKPLDLSLKTRQRNTEDSNAIKSIKQETMEADITESDPRKNYPPAMPLPYPWMFPVMGKEGILPFPFQVAGNKSLHN